MVEEQRAQSDFNGAISYLNRLNLLFYACDDASMNLDTFTWYHSLMAIFRELSTEMKDPEINDLTKYAAEVHNLITSNEASNARLKRQEVKSDVYLKLHEFELKLRRILKEAGLQQKMMNDPRRAM